MPPTRFGHIMISSSQPGSAAQLRSNPTMSNGTAAVPCVTNSPVAPAMMNRLWLLPPMARAVVPIQPMVRGWVAVFCGVGVLMYNGPRPVGRGSTSRTSGPGRRYPLFPLTPTATGGERQPAMINQTAWIRKKSVPCSKSCVANSPPTRPRTTAADRCSPTCNATSNGRWRGREDAPAVAPMPPSGLRERLQESIAGFEGSHPQSAAALERVLVLLSNFGL